MNISILKYLQLIIFAEHFQVFYNCFQGASTFQELFAVFNIYFVA